MLGDSLAPGSWPKVQSDPDSRRLAQVVLKVVETQALVWLGAVFAPLLPALGLLSNALHFYTMKLLATFLYQPPARAYTASRTSNVAYSLMLGEQLPSSDFDDPGTGILASAVLRLLSCWTL